MAIHFSEFELSERRRSACRAMLGRHQHGLLLFRPESMYYRATLRAAQFTA